jgi:hypothetical protein
MRKGRFTEGQIIKVLPLLPARRWRTGNRIDQEHPAVTKTDMGTLHDHR